MFPAPIPQANTAQNLGLLIDKDSASKAVKIDADSKIAAPHADKQDFENTKKPFLHHLQKNTLPKEIKTDF